MSNSKANLRVRVRAKVRVRVGFRVRVPQVRVREGSASPPTDNHTRGMALTLSNQAPTGARAYGR